MFFSLFVEFDWKENPSSSITVLEVLSRDSCSSSLFCTLLLLFVLACSCFSTLLGTQLSNNNNINNKSTENTCLSYPYSTTPLAAYQFYLSCSSHKKVCFFLQMNFYRVTSMITQYKSFYAPSLTGNVFCSLNFSQDYNAKSTTLSPKPFDRRFQFLCLQIFFS